ncbi:MAG: hypothetical protein V1870_00535, partial [Candidatus Aenigmatarchaeota archaeon]
PLPNNKLVKFNDTDKNWPNKFAIVISREEPSERNLREMYKKDIPFLYKVAVEQNDGKFLHLKIPVSHLRISIANADELGKFKQNHTTIKIIQESGVSTTAEIVSQEEIDKWNELLAGKNSTEKLELH